MKLKKLKEGDPFEYKGKIYKVGPRVVNLALNATQLAHIDGTVNIYEPVKTFKEQWYHNNKTGEYRPLGNRIPCELPPIYIQWKDEFRKTHGNKRK